MKGKKQYFSASGICAFILLFTAVACTNSTERSGSQELFKPSVYTPVESFTSGVEGPAVDKAGNLYAVNLAHEGTVGKITPDGKSAVFLELPDGSIGNGIRFNSHGDMFIADYANHNILKVDMSSMQLSVYANEPRMNQPNDIAIDSKDRLYASDPDWETSTGNIWRIEVDGSTTLLASDMGTANGIEVSPNDKILYVNETVQRKVWAYDLSGEGEISNKRLLIEFPDFGMDGMRCDTSGNIYITRYGKGTVVKVSPEGKVLDEITLIGKNPSNIAFGGKGGRTAYVCVQDQGNIETFQVDIPGREWEMIKSRTSLK